MPVKHASRTKRVRFINEAGPFAMRKAVEAMIARHGPDFLTDEQLAEIVSEQVLQYRRQARNNRRNREFYARVHG